MSAKIKRIVYEFGDSSVPPPYHRSYTIDVIPSRIEVKVDSYGDILAVKIVEISATEFEKINQALTENDIKNCELKGRDGCTGGTSERISTYDADGKAVLEGSVYHCGGDDTGNLCGDTGAFADMLRNLIPNFASLLE